MTQDFDLTDVIDIALDNRLSAVHTSMPGTIVAYNRTSQTVSVQPAFWVPVEDEDGTSVPTRLPVLRDIPLLVSSGGAFRITMPVLAGDECMIHFSEGSISNWRARGTDGDPDAQHRFNLNDAWAVVGKTSSKSAWTTATASSINIGHDTGAQVDISQTNVHLGATTATQAVVLGDAFKSSLNTLLDALSAALGAVASGSAGTAILDPAITTFKAAWASNLSAIVKSA